MSYPGRAPHVLAWLQHAAGVAKLVALVLCLWDVWAPQAGAPGALGSPEMLIRYGVEAARRALSVSEGIIDPNFDFQFRTGIRPLMQPHLDLAPSSEPSSPLQNLKPLTVFSQQSKRGAAV